MPKHHSHIKDPKAPKIEATSTGIEKRHPPNGTLTLEPKTKPFYGDVASMICIVNPRNAQKIQRKC